ncbi:hypothetical protein B0H13DRAFT_1896092 [Mycena leptocephala]|nr:hypothetical protein B0H13DRAFT_1896092 [Mycena leptocephala]
MPKQDQNIRVSAHQLMDFRDHDNDSWDLGGGGGRAKVSCSAKTRRREGNSPGPEERVTVFMEIICDAKCLAVDSTWSQAPIERKRVADEDISARPPKRTARS